MNPGTGHTSGASPLAARPTSRGIGRPNPAPLSRQFAPETETL